MEGAGRTADSQHFVSLKNRCLSCAGARVVSLDVRALSLSNVTKRAEWMRELALVREKDPVA